MKAHRLAQFKPVYGRWRMEELQTIIIQVVYSYSFSGGVAGEMEIEDEPKP